MRWIAKAALQNVLAVVPKGQDVNHRLQRKLTRSLPGNDDYFRLKARKALWHFRAFQRHHRSLVQRAAFLEFGAGWDLIGPLIIYGLGIDDQVVLDATLMLHFDLVAHSIRQYAALAAELEAAWGRTLRPLGEPVVRTVEELKERFGISYRAPCDAAATGLPSNSLDFVSSTSTLQHIPEEQIAPILTECRRLLRPSGLMSCHIDMPDGFSHFDHTLSPYNFLKFSDRTWALVNSPFYFQNRLRARDFVALFNDAGFDVVERELAPPNEEELAELGDLRLAQRFRSYSLDELAVKQISLVAVKA